MRKRKLGSTDIEVSVIGLGTWPMGSVYGGMSWGPQDDQESINTILHAFDKGINWIDTAAVYGLGHAEEVVGKALRASIPPQTCRSKFRVTLTLLQPISKAAL